MISRRRRAAATPPGGGKNAALIGVLTVALSSRGGDPVVASTVHGVGYESGGPASNSSHVRAWVLQRDTQFSKEIGSRGTDQSGQVMIVGGHGGCLGYQTQGKSVLLIFPPGSRVTTGRRDLPEVKVAGTTLSVGDEFTIRTLNKEPTDPRELIDIDTAGIPEACRDIPAVQAVEIGLA